MFLLTSGRYCGTSRCFQEC